MELVLTDNFPFFFDTSEKEKDKSTDAVNKSQFRLTGVKFFKWSDTLTVEFETFEHYKAARSMTLWASCDVLATGKFILTVSTAAHAGYDHPVILIGNQAWGNFALVPENKY